MSEKFVVKGGLSIPTGKKLELQGTEVDASAAELNVLNTFGLTDILDEDNLASDSNTALASQQSIKAYVDGKNSFTLSDGVNTTSIEMNEVLVTSDDDAMTITVSDNAIGFAIDLDDSSIEADSTNGLQVKALGVTNAMLAGSIANTKLVNDSVSFGGVSLDLGGEDATPAFDLTDATAYPGDSSLVTTGTIASGVWQGTTIKTDYIEDGNITNAKLADSAVDTEELADDAVTADKLDSDAVVTASIVDANVTNAKMAADSVDSAQYVNGSIDSEHIAAGTIANDRMANDSVSFGGVSLDLGGSDGTPAFDLTDATAYPGDSSLVTTGTITSGVWQGTTIKTDYIEDLNVTTDKLAADAVTAAKLADNAVVTANIVDANVTNIKLANDSVTVTAGNGLSGGGEVELGSSVTLDLDLSEASAEVIDNANDTFLFIDADDDSTKSESIADLVAGMDGTGLTAASGSLSVDASQTQVTELGTITTGEWNATKVSGTYIDDATIDSNHYVDGSIDSEHIAAGTIANDRMANDSVTVTAGNGLSGGGEVELGSSVTLDLDLSEATAEVIDNSADTFLFIDATDDSTKKESIADLVAGMDGTGLTAASGSLSVDATQAQITGIGTSGQMTTFAGTVNVDEAVTLDTTLGVTGAATFTAEAEFNGGINCDGTLAMEQNEIQGTASNMLLRAGSSGDDYDFGAGADGIAIQASGGIMLADNVQCGGNIVSDTDDMDSLGSSSKRWSEVHTTSLELQTGRLISFAGTPTSDAATAVFSFQSTDYKSAKVTMNVSDGTDYTAREFLMVCDENGANPALVEYAIISSGASDLGDFTIAINGTAVELKAANCNNKPCTGMVQVQS